ncbi:MAG: response regulator [Armatimonadetes bacterium]|nr:response regulator [Armatimonadota bacterium]
MRGKRWALVVEDDASWQEILQEILVDSGFAVEVAGSLREALEVVKCRTHRLAVVDLSLGGPDHRNQDGLRVLEALKRQDPQCRAVLLTGFATVELAVSALTEYGAASCLRKESFVRDQLVELVRQALTTAPALRSAGDRRALGGSDEPSAASAGDALVVEDDAGWRTMIEELLQEEGLRVQTCSSFAEGRGHLARGRFRLAVVDLSLASSVSPEGNVDGFHLLDAAREAGTPTLLVSGTAVPSQIEGAYARHGAFACIEKHSFDRQAFLDLVRAARRARSDPGLESLTEREREVLELLAQGDTNPVIAEKLFISTNTVKRHLKAIFEKLGVRTRAAAAARATRAGG